MTVLLTASVWAVCILKSRFVHCGSDNQGVVSKETVEFVPSYKPFQFAFQSNDGLGTTQHRRESGDADGAVTGAYGYVDPFGVYRAVEYVADVDGFRAVVKTNEPGTAAQSTADAMWIVQSPPKFPQPPEVIQQFPPADQVQFKVKTANYTPAASAISRPLYPQQRVRTTLLPLPFPILAQSKGIFTL